MKRIVIDPGHGGKDPGAQGVLECKTYDESDLNLIIAERLAIELASYNPVLTRRSDVFIELEDRADISNRNNADLFISIHCNAATSIEAKGMEVWHCKGSEKGRQLACSVMNRMAKLPLKNRGVKDGNFAVLRLTKCPAILVECGFVTNTEDLGFLTNTNKQLAMVEAIADGVFEYTHC